MKTKNAKTHRKITIKQSLAQIAGTKATYPHYQGAPLAATPGEVWKRQVETFKNARCEVWLLINRTAGTYTFANTYNDKLKSSYRPDKYTYDLTPAADKRLATKIADMVEVPAEEWAEWITPAVKSVEAKSNRRGRKAK